MGGLIPQPTSSDRFRDHAFELAVMVAFLFVGLALLLVPGAAERSPVGRTLEGWQPVWATLYVIGCPTTIVGLFRGSARLRVAGLALAGGGMVMQGVAAVTFAPRDPRTFSYLVFAVACILRAHAAAMYAQREERCRRGGPPLH